MRARVVLFLLLAVVAASAAVLSFSALEALGRACGFGDLSFLLPVVLDAGACAGTVSWLSSPPGVARLFGRRLALLLLAASIAGNGIGHFLAAYNLPVPWLLLIAVSGLAPMVLAAVIHLTVVTAQGDTAAPETAAEVAGEGIGNGDTPTGDRHDVPDTFSTPDAVYAPPREGLCSTETPADPVAELIADGVGRRRLAKELDITEHAARQLLAQRTTGLDRTEPGSTSVNGHRSRR